MAGHIERMGLAPGLDLASESRELALWYARACRVGSRDGAEQIRSVLYASTTSRL